VPSHRAGAQILPLPNHFPHLRCFPYTLVDIQRRPARQMSHMYAPSTRSVSGPGYDRRHAQAPINSPALCLPAVNEPLLGLLSQARCLRAQNRRRAHFCPAPTRASDGMPRCNPRSHALTDDPHAPATSTVRAALSPKSYPRDAPCSRESAPLTACLCPTPYAWKLAPDFSCARIPRLRGCFLALITVLQHYRRLGDRRSDQAPCPP